MFPEDEDWRICEVGSGTLFQVRINYKKNGAGLIWYSPVFYL